MNKLKNGIVSLLLVCSAAPAFADVAKVDSSKWELKGIHLGDTTEQFQSKFPNATCEASPKDAALVTCVDKTVSFSDKPAHFRAHFLDGKSVRVAIERIEAEATLAASGPLIEKYGEPKIKKKKKAWYLSKYTKQVRWYETWVWQDGQIELRTQPADDTQRDPDFTWAAIVLVDHFRYDEVFFPRNLGKPAASLPSIEAAKNDI